MVAKINAELVRTKIELYLLGDATRLQGLTGWRPQYDLASTLRWMTEAPVERSDARAKHG